MRANSRIDLPNLRRVLSVSCCLLGALVAAGRALSQDAAGPRRTPAAANGAEEPGSASSREAGAEPSENPPGTPAEKSPPAAPTVTPGQTPGQTPGRDPGDSPGPTGRPQPSTEGSTEAVVQEKPEKPAKPLSAYWPRKLIEIELSLQDAVRLALQNNLDIQIARLDFFSTYHDLVVEESVFDPFVSLGSNYAKNRRPTASFLDIGGGGLAAVVQVNPSQTIQYSVGFRGLVPIGTTYSLTMAQGSFDRPLASGPGGIFGINPQIEASVTARLTQPLLKGAWYDYNVAQIRIASNTRRLSRSQLAQTAMDIIYQVEEAYWQLAFALKNFESKSKAIEVAEENVANDRKRRDVGTLAPIDVVNTESQAALRRMEFNDSELLLEDSRDALLELVNRTGTRSLKRRWEMGEKRGPFDRLLIVPTTTPELRPFAPRRETALRTAFEERPDYKQIDLELKNQELRVGIARNELLPQLDLTAGWDQFGLEDSFDESYSSLGSGDFYSWSIGVQIEIPIPNRGPRHTYRRAQDEVRRIRLRRTQLENIIVVDVDRSIRRLKFQRRKVGDLEEREQLQEQILDAERKKLSVGKSIRYTVSTIENDLVDIQAQALRAKADYQTAQAEFYRATGTLLRKHHIEVAP
ncbi:MAG: TolC family protein [Planctomycetota bacterium]|nr:TolC family protein [Planctomycetota bacterium]